MSLKTLAFGFALATLSAGIAQAGGTSTPNVPPGHAMHQHDHNNGKGKKLGHEKHHASASTSKGSSYAKRIAASYRKH